MHLLRKVYPAMKLISEVVFDAALNSLRIFPRSQQKQIVMSAYERGVLSIRQVDYAITLLKLEDA